MTASKSYNSKGISISLVSSPEQWNLPDLRQEWEKLLESSNNLDLVYQSPQWFDHLVATNPDDVHLLLGVAKNEAGRHLGIVPILIDQYSLKFDISARALWKIYLQTAFILGSQPRLPQDMNSHDLLFKAILDNLQDCDCIYMESVPTESFLWHYLQKSKIIQNQFMLYVPNGVRPYHTLLLPSTFEEYLSEFKSKRRRELKRRVNVVREHVGGDLKLIRVEFEDQIKFFLEGATSVARNSWQQRRIGVRIDTSQKYHAKLADLAKRGLLRSYLLMCGGVPWAFLVSYQFYDVFYLAEIAYDQSFSKFSPGIVLLYLLINDLTNYKQAHQLNFSIGHSIYKKQLCNIHSTDASVLLLRKTLTNKIRQTAHSLFRSCISTIKRQIQKNE